MKPIYYFHISRTSNCTKFNHNNLMLTNIKITLATNFMKRRM